jgi:hypothetical protein
MKLSYIDTSNFLRSLLVLIKKDNIIHAREVELLKSIGEELGFEKEFYEATVEEFLSKKKIDISIPKFSSQKVTIKFIYESIKMGFIDNYFHIKELEWLYEVAGKNKIPTNFVDKKLVEYLKKYPEKKKELAEKWLKKLKRNYDI